MFDFYRIIWTILIMHIATIELEQILMNLKNQQPSPI